MNNCQCQQRCRPCRPCRPCCGGQGGNQGGGCGNIETIVEPTVHCRVTERHHHRRVRHIIPVVQHQVHHHHTHREFEIRRRNTQEHNHHEHGRRPENVCGLGRGQVGGFEGFQGFDQACDNGEEFFA